jgi:hypothetical protein
MMILKLAAGSSAVCVPHVWDQIGELAISGDVVITVG